MTKLLIIGGAINPLQQVVHQQDRQLDDFLAPFAVNAHPQAQTGDNPHFWFELTRPYFPFKTAPVLQHRVSHDSVIGLAELILEQQARSLGIPTRIIDIGQVLDLHGRLRLPALFQEYDLLAISTTYLPPQLLAPLLRYIPRHVKIFIGGPGAGKVSEQDLAAIRFGYFLRSEGEERFRELLRHARGEAVDLNAIPGLSWREGRKLVHASAPYSSIDLGATVLPDFSKMAAAQAGKVIYESARGCPFRCEFCDYPFLLGNQQFRYKSAERIHHDWQQMQETMGVSDILCLDSLFTYPPQRLQELCRLLCRSGLNRKLRWGCYARADDVAAADNARQLREAGCEYVYIGFESGNQQVLDFMNKRCRVEDSYHAVANCRQAGIMTIGLFIVGFPGETPEMFASTREFLRQMPPFMISVVPWMPDLADTSKVPVMQPARRDKYRLQIEHPSARAITLWKDCPGKKELALPWGFYWSHCGMDLQQAWDCIATIVQDVHEHKIRALCEEFFLPRRLDDPLTLYQKLGSERALDFYLGLGQMVNSGSNDDFSCWSQRIGIKTS